DRHEARRRQTCPEADRTAQATSAGAADAREAARPSAREGGEVRSRRGAAAVDVVMFLRAVLILLALVAPRIAGAQDKLEPQAQGHLDAALKAYEAKDWDVAIREFEQAYALDPKPALLYATAQAYRFANHCGKALELYRRYLAGKLTDTQITAAKTGIS